MRLDAAKRPVGQVLFCGREEAEAACRAWSIPTVVSMSDPGSPRPRVEGASQILRLRFHDVESAIHGYAPPTAGDVSRLVSTLNAGLYPALIHCEMGLSRSAAGAMIAHYLLCGDEAKAAKRMLESRSETIRPELHPNRLMLYYADCLLGSKLLATADGLGITRGTLPAVR
jgi:predicted protein tyrosine phosphatase